MTLARKFGPICGILKRNFWVKKREDTRIKMYKTIASPQFVKRNESWGLTNPLKGGKPRAGSENEVSQGGEMVNK